MTLLEHLLQQLDLTRQQAEGGIGLLLALAQTRLSPDDFQRVADAIPAISDLIGKAPRQSEFATGPLLAAWERWFSGWGELAPLRQACEGLELDRATTDKIATAVGLYFRQQAGSEVEVEVESLLLGIWR